MQLTMPNRDGIIIPTNGNWTGRMRGGFAPNPTRVGAPPWTRRRRMLRDMDHQQLAAVAWMTQFTASGQASEAGQAVRKAHSEKPPDSQKMNSFIFWPVRRFFFCPEALVTTLKLQAQIVCERSQAGSPGAFFAAFFLRKKARNPLCQIPVRQRMPFSRFQHKDQQLPQKPKGRKQAAAWGHFALRETAVCVIAPF